MDNSSSTQDLCAHFLLKIFFHLWIYSEYVIQQEDFSSKRCSHVLAHEMHCQVVCKEESSISLHWAIFGIPCAKAGIYSMGGEGHEGQELGVGMQVREGCLWWVREQVATVIDQPRACATACQEAPTCGQSSRMCLGLVLETGVEKLASMPALPVREVLEARQGSCEGQGTGTQRGVDVEPRPFTEVIVSFL